MGKSKICAMAQTLLAGLKFLKSEHIETALLTISENIGKSIHRHCSTQTKHSKYLVVVTFLVVELLLIICKRIEAIF